MNLIHTTRAERWRRTRENPRIRLLKPKSRARKTKSRMAVSLPSESPHGFRVHATLRVRLSLAHRRRIARALVSVIRGSRGAGEAAFRVPAFLFFILNSEIEDSSLRISTVSQSD